jgi:type II secretory pathway component PulJ
MRKNARNLRGLTLLELTISVFILLVVILITTSVVVRDRSTYRALTGGMGSELRARHALEQIVSDLRLAGEWGEDANRNSVLDFGEDLNRNFILDAHWNLADGTAGQNTLSLNRRMDERLDGELKASGIYSERISYTLVGDRLVRECATTRPDGSIRTDRAEIASRISALEFSRQGRLVEVELELRVPPETYAPGIRTHRATVWLRN